MNCHERPLLHNAKVAFDDFQSVDTQPHFSVACVPEESIGANQSYIAAATCDYSKKCGAGSQL